MANSRRDARFRCIAAHKNFFPGKTRLAAKAYFVSQQYADFILEGGTDEDF